jgi:hypothetical protein
MYRYEVTSLVKSDIEGVVGRPLFYEDDSKFYINDPDHQNSFQYFDSQGETVTSNLDTVCNQLYSSDFLANSTKHTYAEVQSVEMSEKTSGGRSLLAIKKADGISFSRVSHDFTNRTTWYTQAKQILDETLVGSGLGPYSSSKPNWIDVTSGNIFQEYNLTSYIPQIKVAGVLKVLGVDYTVDYATGAITFVAIQTGVVTASYFYEDGADYILEPDPGKILGLEHSEIQFSKDVQMLGAVNFEIWVYNPLFNSSQKIVPEDPSWYPGKPSEPSRNQLRFMYKFEKYKNIKDVINSANLGQGFIPKCAGLNNDVLVFPFNYVTEIKLLSSQGGQLRITLEDDTAFTGEWATVTFYCTSEDDV